MELLDKLEAEVAALRSIADKVVSSAAKRGVTVISAEDCNYLCNCCGEPQRDAVDGAVEISTEELNDLREKAVNARCEKLLS